MTRKTTAGEDFRAIIPPEVRWMRVWNRRRISSLKEKFLPEFRQRIAPKRGTDKSVSRLERPLLKFPKIEQTKKSG
jgi:hypothetical protein